jgi:hypothetical protein
MSEIFLEKTIAHDGNSMKYQYTNAYDAPYYAEADAYIEDLPSVIGSDWTANCIQTLSLWFYGLAGNDANEQMYIKLRDSASPVQTATVIYDGDMNDIKEASWHEWNIALQDFVAANPEFDLSKVAKIIIGFGDGVAPEGTGAGTVYFDDIRLCATGSALAKRESYFAKVGCASPGDSDGDCVINYNEIMVMVNDWLMVSPFAYTNVNAYDETMDFKDFVLAVDI